MKLSIDGPRLRWRLAIRLAAQADQPLADHAEGIQPLDQKVELIII
jgi:hypothetical protein